MKRENQQPQNMQEEYGMEFGDVNAYKYYELRAGEMKSKEKEKKKPDPTC